MDDEPLAAAATRYSALLRELTGTPAILDAVQLGLGTDGHTASLVPGDPALAIEDADIAIAEPYEGHRRMTLTFPVINRARQVLWLVTGAAKAAILARFINGHDQTLPANRVARQHALLIADREAAAQYT